MLNFFQPRPLGKLICGVLILTLLFSACSKANNAKISARFDADATSYPPADVQSSFDAELSKSARALPRNSLPFFDNINNPVTGLGYGSPADVTPPPPVLNSFDLAVNQLCGAPGKVVSEDAFKTMMNNNTTVLENIKANVGGYLVSGHTSNQEFLEDLTAIWFKAQGFDHVFCGEPNKGGSIGGLHYAARYLDLQNKGLAGRLANNTRNQEVMAGAVYTIGAVMKVGNGISQSSIKGYPYTLNAEEILAKAALAYKNNPNTSPSNKVCLLSVTDENKTFKAVFVTKNSAIRTFYPDATPDNSSDCKD
ncbi:EndoU domain-containing protein [Microseira wollei]|uniref:Bacterial EndoU nuclease domain-containing protein n=1 Tax=Microseira wollei NIES-4236 TaxID=2530354 RepID=A0AAV3WM44_9CYAN|nr:EndoU domain-containing protein [Microseira wollei]GET42369.1 hypothetical protein MiSe_71860 [Microseira wollei NIES-4236]